MTNREIKVLHIISSLGIGGAERQLLEIVKENKSHGICQLIKKESWSGISKVTNNQFFDLGMRKGIPDPRAFWYLKKTIEIFKPEIIHTWMYHSSLLEVLTRKVFKNDHIPLVWGIRCSDMDTKFYSTQLKLVINGCRFFSSVPNIIVSNSSAGERFHKNLGFYNESYKIIANGINTDKFKPEHKIRINFRKRWKINASTKVFLCVARVDPMKDHSTLLKAFTEAKKNFKDIVLVLAGKNTNKYSNTDGVIALGQCDKVEEIYPTADFIISSSAFGEGFSNALGEGMSSGLIPISTKVGDAESIVDGKGILIEPKDLEGLKSAIEKVSNIDSKSLKNKTIQVRNHIIEKYSRSRMLKAYDKIYNDLVDIK